MELYKRIKARREELGMSQEELATKLGYKSRSTINKIEMGKNDITQSKIIAFANALQTTPSSSCDIPSSSLRAFILLYNSIKYHFLSKHLLSLLIYHNVDCLSTLL